MRAAPIGLAVSVVVATCAHDRVASAEGIGPDLAEPEPPVEPTPSSSPSAPTAPAAPMQWYGGEVLLVDLASDLAMLGGALLVSNGSDNGGGGVVALLGGAGYLTGGPIVHAAHSSSGRIVAGSLGLRFALPLLGAAVGAFAASGCSAPPPSTSSDFSFDLSGLDCLGAQLQGMLIGFGVGMLTAQIVDAAFLSTEPARAAPGGATAHPSLFVVEPTLGTLRDSERRLVPTLGIVAAF